MGEVGVHLHDRRRTSSQRFGEAGPIGRSQSKLAGPMEDDDSIGGLARQVFGQAAGAIRGTVIDDQQSETNGKRPV
jgi:hypothetical protein